MMNLNLLSKLKYISNYLLIIILLNKVELLIRSFELKSGQVMTKIITSFKDIYIHPNPIFDDNLHIKNLVFSDKIKISIYDIAGDLVKDWDLDVDKESGEVFIKLKNLSSGIYFLLLENKDNNQKRIIKFAVCK